MCDELKYLYFTLELEVHQNFTVHKINTHLGLFSPISEVNEAIYEHLHVQSPPCEARVMLPRNIRGYIVVGRGKDIDMYGFFFFYVLITFSINPKLIKVNYYNPNTVQHSNL